MSKRRRHLRPVDRGPTIVETVESGGGAGAFPEVCLCFVCGGSAISIGEPEYPVLAYLGYKAPSGDVIKLSEQEFAERVRGKHGADHCYSARLAGVSVCKDQAR